MQSNREGLKEQKIKGPTFLKFYFIWRALKRTEYERVFFFQKQDILKTLQYTKYVALWNWPRLADIKKVSNSSEVEIEGLQ